MLELGTPRLRSIPPERLTSLAEDDITLALANRRPNEVASADASLRRGALLRALARALMIGAGDDDEGSLGWENMAAGTNRSNRGPI